MSDDNFTAFQIRSGSELLQAHEAKMYLLKNNTRERMTVTPSGIALDPKGMTAVSKITAEMNLLQNSGIISIESLNNEPVWVNENSENGSADVSAEPASEEQPKTTARKTSKKVKESTVSVEAEEITADRSESSNQAEVGAESTEETNILENAEETSIKPDESGDNVNITSDPF